MAADKNKPWGPDNPHPLLTLRTQLVWEGRYDEFGNRRALDIAGQAMPMQRIETVDQPRFEAAALGQTDLFEKQHKRQDDFRNMLIWGDNKLVIASLLKDFQGSFDFIYIDPPFDVGADFTMNVAIGDERETTFKDQSTLEMVAYRDMWGRGTASYLHMLYERLSLMSELLAETGLLAVHLDDTVAGYVRVLLDELLGRENYINSVTWKRSDAHSDIGQGAKAPRSHLRHHPPLLENPRAADVEHAVHAASRIHRREVVPTRRRGHRPQIQQGRHLRPRGSDEGQPRLRMERHYPRLAL